MAYRFRRSIKLAPGVRLNLGKKGSSISVGGRGNSLNFGSRGVYNNVGIPGTGLSYRSKIGGTAGSQYRSTQPNNSRQPGANYIQMQVTLSLQDDGSIAFKDAQGNLLSDDYIVQVKRQKRDFIASWLDENCFEINQNINGLINIHLTTPPPDTQISFVPEDFEEQQPVPPSEIFPEQKTAQPTLKEYGFLAKRIEFFSDLVDKKNAKLMESYKDNLRGWEERKSKFEADYSLKYKEYQEKLEKYNKTKTEFTENQEKRRKFVEEDRLTDLNAMQEFLIETLQTILWPRETSVSFEVVNKGECVLLDVDLPEIDEMPEQLGVVNKKDFRINYKDISETQKRKNYFTHIHGIGFRLIGEVFVSLPSAATVVFSGYSQRPSKKTGQIENEYLFSVRVSREKWRNLNFNNLEAIDVVSCFETFDLRREATKTGVITPIEPFQS